MSRKTDRFQRMMGKVRMILGSNKAVSWFPQSAQTAKMTVVRDTYSEPGRFQLPPAAPNP